jgi:hypothetical protein
VGQVAAAEKKGGDDAEVVAAGQAGADEDNPLPWLNAAAAYVYFFSLLAALVGWLLTGLSPFAAEILRTMSLSLVGVIAGVLAVMLNVRKPAEPPHG